MPTESGTDATRVPFKRFVGSLLSALAVTAGMLVLTSISANAHSLHSVSAQDVFAAGETNTVLNNDQTALPSTTVKADETGTQPIRVGVAPTAMLRWIIGEIARSFSFSLLLETASLRRMLFLHGTNSCRYQHLTRQPC